MYKFSQEQGGKRIVIWGKVDHKWLTMLAKVKAKKTAITTNLTPHSPRMGAWTSYKKIKR